MASDGGSASYDTYGSGGGGGGGQRNDQCRALYAYAAEDPEELTIAEGDYLTIEDEDDEGWYGRMEVPGDIFILMPINCRYYGRNAQGTYGKFPSNYVELIQ